MQGTPIDNPTLDFSAFVIDLLDLRDTIAEFPFRHSAEKRIGFGDDVRVCADEAVMNFHLESLQVCRTYAVI